MRNLVKLYNQLQHTRERRFGFDVVYPYLPDDFARTFLVLPMDGFWFNLGLAGYNKCLIPKGYPHSLRFDSQHKYFQAWIGSYFITSIIPRSFKSLQSLAAFLSQTAVYDQRNWLRLYGIKSPNVHLVEDTMQFLSQRSIGTFTQYIFSGQIKANIDDRHPKSRYLELFSKLATRTLGNYNEQVLDPQWLIPDNDPTLGSKQITLAGYFSIIKVKPRKFILSYVCADLRNKSEVDNELWRVISSIELKEN